MLECGGIRDLDIRPQPCVSPERRPAAYMRHNKSTRGTCSFALQSSHACNSISFFARHCIQASDAGRCESAAQSAPMHFGALSSTAYSCSARTMRSCVVQASTSTLHPCFWPCRSCSVVRPSLHCARQAPEALKPCVSATALCTGIRLSGWHLWPEVWVAPFRC